MKDAATLLKTKVMPTVKPRQLLGEDLGPLSVKELQKLEKQLEGTLSQAWQRKQEHHLGDINKQLKSKLEVEGQGFRVIQGSWNSVAVVGDNSFSVQTSQSNPIDCEPTLQIGYNHFDPPEGVPRSVAGESNFIHGWIL
ncbi:hypothetical protein HHK36_027860 [Tetracentron sinense]|uniref:K-box domain-containing protein n=1 Tax=Tetracentron sinense TaxID=13715 RepID=A0A834YHE3_TETSI|nr:hypothetical protein HHK36_027860 [Tetracentron sinense]